VLRVNALGTLYVLEAARACAHQPRVLVTSSAEVYGAVPEDLLPVTEDAPLAPVTPYAASKVASEYIGIQAHLAHGLPVLRTRPFNHVGPGQSTAFVVPALAERIVRAHRGGATSIMVGNLIQNQFAVARDQPFGSAVAFLLTFVVLVLVAAGLRKGEHPAGEVL